ncbi:protein FAM216A isoform X2 [Pangasianodon hypophthalmus]|uniref:protein FAM216A isoform X2 n=1 Tax=Pangasianodon hypophthalmus TaxID=310915 RepID=UPI000EFF3CA3|nr:protein FAM216A isoform X2 [Pangasianodon hypophthalmus]
MNSSPTSRSSGFTHTIQLNFKNPEYGLKNLRQRTGPLQPQHFNTIDIPKAMLTAPFLQYSALTPGQKRYLCSICEAYSEAHMRTLMQQHYLNVLHRSIRTGNFITNTQLRKSPPDLDYSSTQQKERSDGKAKGQKDKSRSKEMTVFPKINRQQKRSPESILKKSGPRLKKENHGLI